MVVLQVMLLQLNLLGLIDSKYQISALLIHQRHIIINLLLLWLAVVSLEHRKQINIFTNIRSEIMKRKEKTYLKRKQ